MVKVNKANADYKLNSFFSDENNKFKDEQWEKNILSMQKAANLFYEVPVEIAMDIFSYAQKEMKHDTKYALARTLLKCGAYKKENEITNKLKYAQSCGIIKCVKYYLDNLLKDKDYGLLAKELEQYPKLKDSLPENCFVGELVPKTEPFMKIYTSYFTKSDWDGSFLNNKKIYYHRGGKPILSHEIDEDILVIQDRKGYLRYSLEDEKQCIPQRPELQSPREISWLGALREDKGFLVNRKDSRSEWSIKDSHFSLGEVKILSELTENEICLEGPCPSPKKSLLTKVVFSPCNKYVALVFFSSLMVDESNEILLWDVERKKKIKSINYLSEFRQMLEEEDPDRFNEMVNNPYWSESVSQEERIRIAKEDLESYIEFLSYHYWTDNISYGISFIGDIFCYTLGNIFVKKINLITGVKEKIKLPLKVKTSKIAYSSTGRIAAVYEDSEPGEVRVIKYEKNDSFKCDKSIYELYFFGENFILCNCFNASDLYLYDLNNRRLLKINTEKEMFNDHSYHLDFNERLIAYESDKSISVFPRFDNRSNEEQLFFLRCYVLSEKYKNEKDSKEIAQERSALLNDVTLKALKPPLLKKYFENMIKDGSHNPFEIKEKQKKEIVTHWGNWRSLLGGLGLGILLGTVAYFRTELTNWFASIRLFRVDDQIEDYNIGKHDNSY